MKNLLLHPNKAGLIVILAVLEVLSLLAPSHACGAESNVYWDDEYETVHDDCEAYYQTVVAANPEKLELVKRMASLIHPWKIKHDQGAWIECGKRIRNETQSLARAFTYAWHIVDASEAVSNEHYTLIPWTLTAIYAHESVFDSCALGPSVRKWAYKRELVKKRHILSHYKKDVIKIITDKTARRVFRRTGFDLGPCQLLTQYHDGPILDMLDVREATRICAHEAWNRGVNHDVKQPQLLWPNGNSTSKKAKKYRQWVNRRMRRMGVTTFELFNDELWYKKTLEMKGGGK